MGGEEGFDGDRAVPPASQDDAAWHILFAVSRHRRLPHRWRAERPRDKARTVHDAPDALSALGEAGEWDCAVIDLSLPEARSLLHETHAHDPDVFRVPIVDEPVAADCNSLVARGLAVLIHPVQPGDLAQLLNGSPQPYRGRLRRVARRLARRHGLTPREGEILKWRGLGATRPDICKRIGIRPKTYDNHVASLMSKSGAQRTDDLVLRLRRLAGIPQGLTGLDSAMMHGFGDPMP